jgi:hypothetical protein
MSYAPLPQTNIGLQHHDHVDMIERNDRSVDNISPFLTRGTGYNSPRFSVSTDPETDTVATTRQLEANWQQISSHDLMPQNHSYPGDGDSLEPEITVETSLGTQAIGRPNTSKPSKPLPSLLQLVSIWKWELSTWVLGTIGYAAIIILMIMFNDKLQKDWHSDVQITAFVAALAQVSQSALLVPTASSIAQLKWKWISAVQRPAMDIQRFDLASRGPDGSMRLLWHFALRQ